MAINFLITTLWTLKQISFCFSTALSPITKINKAKTLTVVKNYTQFTSASEF